MKLYSTLWKSVLEASMCQAFASAAQFATVARACNNHGERIWIYRHRRTHQIIYSFKERLDGFHDLKQLPFNGKNTKPAKLRKDYWSPMATIQFPAGQGAVCRSVFQKLRELKHLHEVAWSDGLRRKRLNRYTEDDVKKIAAKTRQGLAYQPIANKRDRGIALNAQQANAIADMAVVLAGQGAGNRVVTRHTLEGTPVLVKVSIGWANDLDKHFAKEWTKNVSHELFKRPTYVSRLARMTLEDDAALAGVSTNR